MNTLGVTVCYFSRNKRPPFLETKYFYQLSNEGEKKQVQIVIFNPKDVNWKTRTVSGWQVGPYQRFEKVIRPLPNLIYDRCYYRNSVHYLKYKPYVTRLLNDPHIRFLGRPLKGKYQTYQLLKECTPIKSFLPETVRYHSQEAIRQMLRKYDTICMKPNGGSHGRGVIKISHDNGHFFVHGRNHDNSNFHVHLINESQFDRWIKQFVKEARYIIQPYLELVTSNGFPFDVRILVQKNENLAWITTGSAVRVGQSHTITSNLHGGGRAFSLNPFLEKHYTDSVQKIKTGIKTITSHIPVFIERNHGPLVELGLDVGIDNKANIWLLEVNSKPGRSVFLQMGEQKIHHLAIQLPILYSKALLRGPRRCNPVIQNSNV